MVSDKTVREVVYPGLRFFLFVFSIVLLNVFITPFLGTRTDYRNMLLNDGVIHFLLLRCLVLIVVFVLSTTLLYGIGVLCKIKTTKKTILILFAILFFIAIFRSWAFIQGNG